MVSTYSSQPFSLLIENRDHHEDHLIPNFSEETKSNTHPIVLSSLRDEATTSKPYHDIQGEQRDQTSSDQYFGNWTSSKIQWDTTMMTSGKAIVNKPRKRKQVSADQQLLHNHDRNNDNKNNTSSSPSELIRVCSDCSTTKTPLWRSGPQGPKSLCNACGIRQRKARRAMAAAVSGGLIPVYHRPNSKDQKVKIVQHRSVLPLKKRCALPFKKRCKIINTSTTKTIQQKIHFDDVIISLSNNSASHKVLPQDEREAAILLMALSC